jgi:tRNA (guanine-N7-)-methyltransferase
VERPVTRTFKPRRRGLSPSRAASYARLVPVWGLAVDAPLLDIDALRDEAAATTVVLDIGFGYGAALVELATAHPDELVIGVDVHTPGVAWVLDEIDARGLRNVRVVEADVLDLLPRIPPASLDGIRIWFPDPWPKARQQRRRLVNDAVVATLVERLRVGGLLHLATDIAGYAEQMERVCAAHPSLEGGVVPRPHWRPRTAYEARGATAGRHAVDLIYRRAR